MNDYGPRTDVILRRDVFHSGVDMWLRRRSCHPDRVSLAYALPVQFKVLQPEDEGLELPHALHLRNDEAQAFMDELWHCGFRPTEGTGSAGSLAATERHLNDMRAIVAKSLSTDLPK